jgi:hypothetical protein
MTREAMYGYFASQRTIPFDAANSEEIFLVEVKMQKVERAALAQVGVAGGCAKGNNNSARSSSVVVVKVVR